MAGAIIDGKAVAAELKLQIAEETAGLKERGIQPGLAVVLVGSDPASQVYVRNKERNCHEVGFYSEVHRLPEETTQEELLALVNQLANDQRIHGILVQLPLPKHIHEKAIIDAIPLAKDVDGFGPENVGNLVIGDDCYLPCTPAGVVELIKRTGLTLEGKHAVVIGRSNIVGKPVAHLLLRENATVTICHSRTADLKAMCRQADVLIAAIGKANFVTSEYIKPGAVVIDVGINRLPDGKLAGDVDFEDARTAASHITPVPGGVGPMTIIMLMKNTLEAAKRAALLS